MKEFTQAAGHAVQKAPPLFQKGEKGLLADDGLTVRPEHQGGVVAEGTAPVAPGGEHRAGGVAGIVQQRQLLQTVDHHI